METTVRFGLTEPHASLAVAAELPDIRSRS